MLFGKNKQNKLVRSLIALVCLVAVVSSSFLFRSEDKVAEAAWYDSNWGYRIALTIPAENIPTEKVIFLTSGSTFTVPADWDSSSNLIETVGGGASGGNETGGGGGAYSNVSNQSLTPGGSVGYAVGGVGGDTYFCDSTSNCASIGGSAVVAGAKGGSSGGSGGAGGSSASGFGTVKTSGGAGGAGGADAGAGGGGAGGPDANGGDGGDDVPTTTGGDGGDANGVVGTGGDGGTNGNVGERGLTDGAISGGGGGGSGHDSNGGEGGNFGGGGGAKGNDAAGSNAAGAPGGIKLTYSATSTLTDFPVYVDLSDLPQHVWDNLRSDCGDLRVTSSNGSTEVPREIVSCNSTGQTGEMHFKAPSVTSASDNVFYIYYGNSAQADYAIDATYGAENVWTNNYQAVFHFESNSSLVDSTSNDRDGLVSGTVATTTGKLAGNSFDFAGSDDFATTTNDFSLSGSDHSVQFWFNADAVAPSANYSTSPVIMAFRGQYEYMFTFGDGHSGDALGARYTDGSYQTAVAAPNIATSTWYQWSSTFSTTSGQTLFFDGNLTEADGDTGTFNAQTQSNIIGGIQPTGNSARSYDGSVDELRISSVTRKNEWVKAEYANQSSPSTFYSLQSGSSSAAEVVYLTSGTSWVVPSDWNSASNTIEVLGAGGSGGVRRVNGVRYGTGGGAGGYAKATNVTLSGTVAYSIGTGGAAASRSSDGGTSGNAGGDTYFCDSTSNCASIGGTAVMVGAEGGGGGTSATGGSISGGSGGLATNAIGGSGGGTTNPGSAYSYSGGDGGDANSPGSVGLATGGGGAAGPSGDGNDAADFSGGGTGSGGSGDAGNGGAGGTGGNDGGDGTQWGGAYGSGGGGGGDRPEGTTATGGDGGNYGGGGGGAVGYSATITSGAGEQGIVIITYTPLDSNTPPDTPVFSSAPTNASSSAITMTATSTDVGNTVETESGSFLEYYFTATTSSCGVNIGTGGTNSGWLATSTYTDEGLQANKCYGYTSTARDAFGTTSATSTASTTYTSAATPGAPVLSSVATSSFVITNTENGNPSSNPTTNFAVQIVNSSPNDVAWNNQYVDASGDPSASAVWLTDAQIDNLTITNLNDDTYFEVRVKARNQDNDETAFSSVTSTTTEAADADPPTPDPPTFVTPPGNDSTSSISMIATAGSDAYGSTPIEYNFTLDNTICGADAGTGGTSSGWQTSTSYTDTGLDTNKCYGYTVTMRDSLGNTTSESTASTTYTSAATPGAPTLQDQTLFVATLAITAHDANGNPSANPETEFALRVNSTSLLDATWDGMYIDASGNPSSSAVWLSDAVWDSMILQDVNESTEYQIQSKARNEDGDETPFGTSGTTNTLADTPKDVRVRGGIRFQSGTMQ